MKEEIERGVSAPPKISVIVPVYNAEKYLHRCIDSILSQTFTDFELLLIDDGSKDKSGAICDEYALKDSRVRVFHKENGGVSSARNVGLDNACGEWISFVDSDDWIALGYLKNLYDQPGGDMRLSLFWIENADKTSYSSAPLAIYNQSLTLQQSIDQLYSRFWNICCNLYRFDIINKLNLRFKDGFSMGEDTFFNYGYLSNSVSISICRYFDYHYQQDNINSLSKQAHTIEEIQMFAAMTTDTFSKFPDGIDLASARRALGYFIIEQLLIIKGGRKTLHNYCQRHQAVKEALLDNRTGIRRCMLNCFLRLGFYRIAQIIHG